MLSLFHVHIYRPLVGSIAAAGFPGKQSTFFGHLTINKLRIHMQRKMVKIILALTTLAHTTGNVQVYKLCRVTTLLRRLKGTDFNVIMEDEDQVELSFKKTWNFTNGNSSAPLNVDKR